MNLEFDKSGLRYACEFIAVFLMVIFSAHLASNELSIFASSGEAAKLPVLAEVQKTADTGQPFYQKLAGADVIFANGEGVLAKKDELEAAAKDFVFADLDAMQITYYSDAGATTTFKIMSKGKDGSFFETPSGIYKIDYKEKNHFSSIGKVWMPWSMHIFGNYFIHGWPYYPSGAPVEAAYSGGCIRLSFGDSGKLYALVKEGTPVLIYSGSHLAAKDDVPIVADAYFKKLVPGKNAKLPKLSAYAFLAADFDNGQILLAKNSTSTYPIASVTKLMTALVASESFQARSIKINRTELATYGSSGGFVNGEIFSSDKLLYPMLLTSSNDAAIAFQNEGWHFVDMMNQKAKAVGMAQTSYADASGLDPNNISTAGDLFTLLKYIYNNKKPIFDILSLSKYTASSDNKIKKHTWSNINWPPGDDRLISGKSGYIDEAKETFAGVFKVRLSEGEDRRVAIVVLYSDSRQNDINKIIKYLQDTVVFGNVLTDKSQNTAPKVFFNEASVFEAIHKN